jgi:hypothetical protein
LDKTPDSFREEGDTEWLQEFLTSSGLSALGPLLMESVEFLNKESPLTPVVAGWLLLGREALGVASASIRATRLVRSRAVLWAPTLIFLSRTAFRLAREQFPTPTRLPIPSRSACWPWLRKLRVPGSGLLLVPRCASTFVRSSGAKHDR